MPRVEFTPWDRVYILKLICTAQMTFSSFVTILYLYLITLQNWISVPETRSGIIEYKWIIIMLSSFDFALGTLLAFAANMRGILRRRRIVIWIILDTIAIPANIFALMRLYYKIKISPRQLRTDPHYLRITLAQVAFFVCHFCFIAYGTDFVRRRKRKKKGYDPNIRPQNVFGPTDPQITTTESRHIRMSQSFLFQQSTSDSGKSTETVEPVKSLEQLKTKGRKSKS